VWRSLLAPASAGATPPAEAQRALLKLRRQPSRWAVVVSSGGHFAAAIFTMAPPPAGRQQPNAERPLYEVAAHKTFHRYVVRYGPMTRWLDACMFYILAALLLCAAG
jgi:Bacteroidetes VLRF1 release factor